MAKELTELLTPEAIRYGALFRELLRPGDADAADAGVLDTLVVDTEGLLKRRPAREVRISDFAKGDGSNERTALLAAIAYAQANNLELVFDKIVAFGGGNITFTNRLLWRGGWGGGLKALQATTMYVRGDRSLVRELDIDWSGFGGTALFVQSRSTEVVRNYVHDSAGHGIAFDGQNASYPCEFSAAIRNIVKNIGDIGIATNAAKALRIQQNDIQSTGLEAITLDNNLTEERGGHIVTGNTCDDVCQTGGVGGFGIDNTHRCLIDNNTITRVRQRPGMCLQNNTGDTTYNTITNNVIRECNGHGLLLYGNANGNRARNNIIAKNGISLQTGDPISVADIETTYNYVEHTYDNAGATHIGGIGNWAPLIIDKPKFLSGLKATQVSATEARLQASGSAASVHASVAGKGPDGRAYLVANGLSVVRVLPSPSAVNFIDITGSAAGGQGPIIQVGGPDADTDFRLASKGDGKLIFLANGAPQLRALPNPAAVNFIDITGSAAGAGPIVQAAGADLNAVLRLASKGDAAVSLEAYGVAQARVLPVLDAVNTVDLSGDVAGGGGVIVQAGGVSANIPLRLLAKGSSPVKVEGGGFTYNGAQVADISSAQTLINKTLTAPVVNGVTVSGTMAGNFTFSGTHTYASFASTDLSKSLADYRPTDYGVGKSRLYLNHETATKFTFGLSDGAGPTGTISHFSTIYQAFGAYNTTTANAPNVNAGPDGTLARSTSSERYKTGIEPMADEWADAILVMEPIYYRSTCTVDNKDWSYWGLSAEAVAEIDPRLVHWRTHEMVCETRQVQRVQIETYVERVVTLIDPISKETVEVPVYGTREVTYIDEVVEAVAVPLEKPIAEGVAYERLTCHLISIARREKAARLAIEGRLSALEHALTIH